MQLLQIYLQFFCNASTLYFDWKYMLYLWHSLICLFYCHFFTFVDFSFKTYVEDKLDSAEYVRPPFRRLPDALVVGAGKTDPVTITTLSFLGICCSFVAIPIRLSFAYTWRWFRKESYSLWQIWVNNYYYHLFWRYDQYAMTKVYLAGPNWVVSLKYHCRKMWYRCFNNLPQHKWPVRS